MYIGQLIRLQFRTITRIDCLAPDRLSQYSPPQINFAGDKNYG